MEEKKFYIETIKPTVFCIRKGDKLLRGVDISIKNLDREIKANLIIKTGSQKENIDLGLIEKGKKIYRVYIPDTCRVYKEQFLLLVNGRIEDRKSIFLKPQKHYKVYLIHYSHHDLGYTDLPSNVLDEYDSFYDDILRFCDKTEKFPEEAKFRYVVEQSWSIVHFIENRPKKIIDKLVRYIKEGRIEITALYGNLITEVCGHEELIRALYPSFKLKRKYNIPISSAEHNDIPGVSWGLAKILANSGIKYFSPGLPLWYFSKDNIHPFWDEEKVISLKIPGAFRWKSQDGKEVLFWYDIHEGELYLWNYNQVLNDLSDKLNLLEKYNYPFSVVSYTVRGGERDNSPPSLNLSLIVKEWNEKWAFPKLILSTNNLFFKELEKELKGKLKVFSGELPDTDYNIGAISTAKETGINRATHNILCSAEKFATVASVVSNYPYPEQYIEKIYKNLLYYDMHCFGFHNIVGPAEDGSWSEKSNFAYKAQAFSYDVLSKSLNKIVDEIRINDNDYYIVVFNPLSFKRTDIVRVLFKEHSPSGLPMHPELSDDGSYSKSVYGTAIGRNIINLPIDILKKGFEIIDTETEESVPYQIVKLKDPKSPSSYASERYALGQIDKSYLFELVFIAKDVPSFGYKSYRIIPSKKKRDFKSSIALSNTSLENRFYKITLDSKTGSIISIYDKELERELVDKKAPHKFNQFIARWSRTGREDTQKKAVIKKGESGLIYGSLIVSTKGAGCPQITEEIILYDKVKRIDILNRILRDSTPLLEMYFSFPFLLKNPNFKFEGTDSVIEPLKDQFPGSNTDYYTIQNWATVYNEEIGITFSSIEAPIVEFGGLWPGYVSGAHHCVTPKGYGHKFLNKFTKGHIYSYIINNNFRTNFKNTQVSDCLFRYSFTSHRGDWRKSKSYQFGWGIHNPLIPVCIKGKKEGILKKSMSFCQVDKPNVLFLTLKEAENKDGLIIRFIETEGKDTVVRISLPFLKIKKVYQTNLMEENQKRISVEKNIIKIPIKGFGIATIRIQNGQ
ncbi:MAG: hypothetical protein DRI36_05695 [Caldiserica bacterium]|nr:MAG: hypothetical protein DRI36_05695 [Caldisericota bacterium]